MTDYRKEIARTPIETHKYQGKRYLTLDGLDQLFSNLESMGVIFPEEGEKWRKLAKDQSYPDMVFYCPECKKMVKNTKCNIVDSNWRKVEGVGE